jgi:hypothetical protein
MEVHDPSSPDTKYVGSLVAVRVARGGCGLSHALDGNPDIPRRTADDDPADRKSKAGIQPVQTLEPMPDRITAMAFATERMLAGEDVVDVRSNLHNDRLVITFAPPGE